MFNPVMSMSGRPSTIVNPGSRFFIGRLRSGLLLLINSPRPDSRTGITAQVPPVIS